MVRRLVTLTGAAILAASVITPSVAARSPDRIAVLISFRSTPTTADLAMVRSSGGIVSRSFRIVPAIAVTIPTAAIAALEANPRVDVVEPDAPLYALEYDPNYDWGVVHIGAQTVHATGQIGTGVRVATIDSGIDCAHVELVANCVYGWNYVSNNGDANDDYGHGTHVAGIIAAALNGTAQGVVGVAPGATVIAYKTLDSSGVGSWSRHIAAIDDIWNNGDPKADIVNMSIGRGSYSSIADQAMQRAYESGIVLVAAAGNSGRCNGKGTNLTYPALFDSVIAVSATDSSDKRPCWSSTGDKVELAAPGVSVFSTWPTDMKTSYLDPQPVCQDLDGDGIQEACHYKYGSGTSMSSPHVAGVAALLIGSGQITDTDGVDGIADEVRQRLDETARDIGPAGRDPLYGFGLVDAAAALAPQGPGGNVAPVANDDAATTAAGTAVTIPVLANDTDANGDSLSVAGLSNPANGSVTANGDGTVTYQPDAGFAGTDTFTYQAFDGALLSNAATVSVTVNGSGSSAILLQVSGSKVRGVLQATLTWTGASTDVDIWRDGAVLTTAANDGTYVDDTGMRGSGSLTYRVCEAGTTSTCSDWVTLAY